MCSFYTAPSNQVWPWHQVRGLEAQILGLVQKSSLNMNYMHNKMSGNDIIKIKH